MPISEEILSKGVVRTIEPGTPCRKCGYDLSGLPSSSLCPECGAVANFDKKKRRLGDALTDAPRSYLKTLAAGASLCAGSVITSTILGIVAYVKYDFPVTAAMWALSSLIWCMGVFIVTQPRQSAIEPIEATTREFARLRWWNRLSQFAWVAFLVEE